VSFKIYLDDITESKGIKSLGLSSEAAISSQNSPEHFGPSHGRGLSRCVRENMTCHRPRFLVLRGRKLVFADVTPKAVGLRIEVKRNAGVQRLVHLELKNRI